MAGTLHRTAWRQSRMPALLPDRATVLRVTQVPDGGGGWTTTEAEVGTYECSLQTKDAIGREGTEAGRIVAVAPYVAYLSPPTADVGPTDILRIGGLRYEVVDSDVGRSDAVVLTVSLRIVE